MRVRLTRKLAESVDGVDLSRCHVGDSLNLPARDARLLIAEHWATPDERRRRDAGPVRVERRVHHDDDPDARGAAS